jgi:hypothetical protein
LPIGPEPGASALPQVAGPARSGSRAGSVTVVTDEAELTLFDPGLVAAMPGPRRSPRPAAGGAREAYLRRVTAEVTVVHPAVLREEALRVLEAAWNRAVDPYTPLRGVPGITWIGRDVTVEQVLARSGRSG